MEADEESVDSRFVICVEDISNVWSNIKPLLESRPAWQGLHLRNKVGISVAVPELQVQYLPSNAPRLRRLRKRGLSPVTWFRTPYVQLILIAGEDPDDYKSNLKGQLKKILEAERELLGGPPEFVIAYVNTGGVETTGGGFLKSSKKVLKAVKGDIGTRKQDRVVKLDVDPQGCIPQSCVLELEKQLIDAFKSCFTARQAAYDDEIRKLTAHRQQPNWDFSALFLVKDSLAVMLESASLLEDALREYAELEALYLTTLPPFPGIPNAPPFGGTSPGDDVAQLVRATWRETRNACKQHGLVQFEFQQFLFACQARILLKLNRPSEVAERGLGLVQSLSDAMEQQAAAGHLPPLFREAWTFSACISLAETTVSIGPPPPTPKPQTPAPPPRQASLPPLPAGLVHKRSTSEIPQNAFTAPTTANPTRRTRSLSHNNIPAISEESTGDDESAGGSSVAHDSDEEGEAGPIGRDSRGESLESATVQQRKSLRPVRVAHNNRSGVGMDTPVSTANGQPREAGHRKQASRHKTGSTPGWRGGTQATLNWALGVPGHLQDDFLQEATPAAWQAADGGDRLKGEAAAASQRHFWCLLGHLYARARVSLGKLEGHFDVPSSTSSPQSAGRGQESPVLGGPPPLDASSRQYSMGHIVGPSRGDAMASGEPPSNDESLAAAEAAVSTPMARTSNGDTPQANLDKQGGGRFVSHTRRLSRFAPGAEPGPRRTESATSFPTHHSRRSSVSEMSTSGFSEAESVGSLMRPVDDFQRPEADLRNLHNVEREVETASEDSGSPNSILRSGRFEASHSTLPWLTEWRLRVALTSTERFQELWTELSGSAASCYTAAGWRRTGEQMVGRLAEVLMARGQGPQAAAILQRQARLFLGEGWLQLAEGVLSDLADCRSTLYQAAGVELCLQLLSMGVTSRDRDPEQTALVQAELVRACEGADANPQLANEAALDALASLRVEPVGGHYSRFFGQSEVDGTPMSSPSAGPSPLSEPGLSAPQGAPQACVGDVLRVPVSLHSLLPQPLALDVCHLSLSILQEVTVVVSPRGGSENPLTRGHGHLRTQSMKSLDTPAAPSGQPHRSHPSMPDIGTPGTAATTQDGQRFGTKWQETEEVTCSPVGTGADPGPGSRGVIEIRPGRNVLWFEVVALKRGLYSLKHLTVSLGKVKLRVEAHLPSLVPQPRAGNLASRKRLQNLGACDDTGSLGEEAILVHVESALQRVGLTAVAPQACLTAGLGQWLGLAVVARHGEVAEASVQVQSLPAPSSGDATTAGRAFVPMTIDPSHGGWLQPLAGPSGDGGGVASEVEQAREGKVSDSGEPSSSGREDGGEDRKEGCSWELDSSGSASLPPWLTKHPCILWMWIRAGELAVHHEVVRVNPLSSHTPLARGYGAGDLPSPVKTPGNPGLELLPHPKGAAEVDVNVDYLAGCQRAHTSRLSIPVLPPFRLHVSGKEVPGQRVALQVSVTSTLSCPATITSLAVDPQPGFTSQPLPPQLASLLPLKVPANGQVHLLLFLEVATAAKHASLERMRGGRLHTTLHIAFRHDVAAFPSSALQEVGNEWNPPLLGSTPLPRPPLQLGEVDGGGEGVQKHSFVLDLPASAAPRSTVFIRLLGPFSAKAGEVVTFCWRLERSKQFTAQHEAEVLQYEIRAEGEGWRPSGGRSGSVRLPLRSSSAATVEATWLPVASGMLPMPHLLLPDIPHQEVFDVGDSNHLINVT